MVSLKDAEGNQIGPLPEREASNSHDREGAVYDLLETVLSRFTANCPIAPESQGTCTNSAQELQAILGGKIYGYHHDDNPTAEVGEVEGGHDFLVVDGWIVDWWLKEYWSKKGIYHLRDDAAEVRKLYGDFKKWQKL